MLVNLINGRVAKLVDALDLGSSAFGMGVRVSSRPPFKRDNNFSYWLFFYLLRRELHKTKFCKEFGASEQRLKWRRRWAFDMKWRLMRTRKRSLFWSAIYNNIWSHIVSEKNLILPIRVSELFYKSNQKLFLKCLVSIVKLR